MRLLFYFLLTVSHFCFAQEYVQNSNTVLKDTAGTVISKKAFWKLHGSAKYGMSPQFDTINKLITEIRLIKLTPEALKNRLEMDSLRKAKKNRIGTLAPSLEVEDIEGKPFSSYENRGKVVVLNFWFIGCKPCRQEMPKLKELTERYKGRDDIVFVSVANDSKKELLKFASQNHFGYSIAETTATVKKNWHIFNFPSNIVIDRQGKLIYEESGYGGNIRGLERAIEKTFD